MVEAERRTLLSIKHSARMRLRLEIHRAAALPSGGSAFGGPVDGHTGNVILFFSDVDLAEIMVRPALGHTPQTDIKLLENLGVK